MATSMRENLCVKGMGEWEGASDGVRNGHMKKNVIG